MTSQVEVEFLIFTIAPLERSSELYWKLDTGSIERGHDHALHQSVARGEPWGPFRVLPFARGDQRNKA